MAAAVSMMRLLVLCLLPTAVLAGAVNCPCLKYFPSGANPAGGVAIGGKSYVYPSTYGIGSCAPHDLGKPPVCDASKNLPAW